MSEITEWLRKEAQRHSQSASDTAFTSRRRATFKHRAKKLRQTANALEQLKVEAACNYCGEYHGKEVCASLQKRIEQLEAALKAIAHDKDNDMPHGGIMCRAIARTALNPLPAGDTLPEDDWRLYECSVCHWKIQALATNAPTQCKLCTNISMREQSVGDSGNG